MGKINGIVKDWKGKILENAEVLFVDRASNVLASGYSNEKGEYYLQINEKTNGMVVGSYSYGEEYLAFIYDNVSTHIPHHIDILVGDVEFVQFRRIITKERGKYTCSFQIASLARMKRGEVHLTPNEAEMSLKFMLDERAITAYELTKERLSVEGRGNTIDSCTLSFPIDQKDRGKVLELIYKDEDSYGTLKSYV